ncbi:hypothetical protein MY11210_009106 [Beauveria gryllotalpidicola]
MPQRQRFSLYIPGSPPGALPETTYTPSNDRRRSLISLTDSLGLGLASLTSRSKNNPENAKPSRTKLQKYWPGARSPTAAHGTAKDCTTTGHDLPTLILLAGEQMGALGDPRRKTASPPPPPPVSRRMDDPKLRRDLEMTLPKSATALLRPPSASIQRKPLPKNAVLQCSAAAPVVPAPSRAPPPPPIPELSAVHYRSQDGEMAAKQSSPPTSPVMRATPVFSPPTARRRAKTPVHRIGQLEAAQRNRNKLPHRNGNMDGVNRMSSVSTIAREYRELAVYPETNVLDVPKIDPLFLMNPDIVELPDAQDTDCQNGRLLGACHYNHHRSSSSVSEDGTLLGSEPDTTSFGSCPSLTTPPSSPPPPPPPAETSDDDSEPPALAVLRFQIGIELLTKELSAAFADQSSRSRRQKDVDGLQIWVMIEAYERLREQLDAKPAEENKQARDAIDAWIRALYAIHGNMTRRDGAADGSEYGSDGCTQTE